MSIRKSKGIITCMVLQAIRQRIRISVLQGRWGAPKHMCFDEMANHFKQFFFREYLLFGWGRRNI